MEPRLAATAAALLIGNELLAGKVAEQNLVELARTLRALGVGLRRVVVVPDEVEAIGDEVSLLAASHDVVFTSGGVGPTHDDVTMEGVARAFGVVVEPDPTLVALLRQAFGERTTEAHLRMALKPAGAELAATDDVRWPTVVMRNVWILPGVPEVFRMKLAVVRACLRGPGAFHTRAVYLRSEEAAVTPVLDRLVASHPGVEIGSYPKWFDEGYRTKITFDGRERAPVDAAVEALLAALSPDQVVRVE